RRRVSVAERPAVGGDRAVGVAARAGEAAGEPGAAEGEVRHRRLVRGLRDRVPAPAGLALVRLEPAGVEAPGAHLGEHARGWGCLTAGVEPPASHRTVGLEPAGVRIARAHLSEGRARGRRRLAGIVEPPAGDGAVSLEPAGLESPGAQDTY